MWGCSPRHFGHFAVSNVSSFSSHSSWYVQPLCLPHSAFKSSVLQPVPVPGIHFSVGSCPTRRSCFEGVFTSTYFVVGERKALAFAPEREANVILGFFGTGIVVATLRGGRDNKFLLKYYYCSGHCDEPYGSVNLENRRIRRAQYLDRHHRHRLHQLNNTNVVFF